MFNSTHTFVGLLIAKTGVAKSVRYATLTAVIASNLPDIDSIAGLWGTAAYLDHHRGITHSLIGVPVLALLQSAVMYFFSGNFGRTFAIALIATATHPALDYLNPYGLRPFLPWKTNWYYGDAVFVIDPYLDLLLMIGILAGILAPKTKRVAAWLSVAVALTYIGARIELHAMAMSKLNGIVSEFPRVERSAVLPEMLNGLWWDGIFQTDDRIRRLPVYALQRPAGVDILSTKTHPPTDIVRDAAKAASCAALLRFSRFPLTRVDPVPSGGQRVMILDFRFYRDGTDTALACEVIFDSSRQVIREDVSFVHTIN
jgi:inner membrane protein